MNDRIEYGTVLKENNGEWLKELNGTYTRYLCIYYRNGRVDKHVVESCVSEKEYFRRKLNGTV